MEARVHQLSLQLQKPEIFFQQTTKHPEKINKINPNLTGIPKGQTPHRLISEATKKDVCAKFSFGAESLFRLKFGVR